MLRGAVGMRVLKFPRMAYPGQSGVTKEQQELMLF